MKKYVNGVLIDLTAEEVAQAEYDAAQAERAAVTAASDAQILALEATVTQRRLREAALTEAGKEWLAQVDAEIAALRARYNT